MCFPQSPGSPIPMPISQLLAFGFTSLKFAKPVGRFACSITHAPDSPSRVMNSIHLRASA